jgi:membrane carboxypeptidase/penicillin-binding protein PbpC
MAEESINENQAVASQYKSNNAAMMYVNSLNGDVMAYVGSRDYYNEEIDGQVDIIQSKRQP